MDKEEMVSLNMWTRPSVVNISNDAENDDRITDNAKYILVDTFPVVMDTDADGTAVTLAMVIMAVIMAFLATLDPDSLQTIFEIVFQS